MRALVLSLLLVTVFTALSYPVEASPSTSDAGNRYRICFTATDSFPNGTLNPFLKTTHCMYITVLGACTKYTADVFLRGQVDIQDVGAVIFHYGQNETGKADPWNPMADSSVDLNDVACVISMFGQTNTLP